MNTTRGLDIIHISHEVRSVLKEAKAGEGVITVIVPQAGAGVFINPSDERPVDIAKGLESLVANKLIRSLLACSVVIPVEGSRMVIEPWQGVYLVDYETSGKRREFKVHFQWEPKEKEAHAPKR